MRPDTFSGAGLNMAISKRFCSVPLMQSISVTHSLSGRLKLEMLRLNQMMCIDMEQTEWNELLAIRREMNENLMALDARTQERYTELLVKSLEGKGDPTFGSVTTPLRPPRSVLY